MAVVRRHWALLLAIPCLIAVAILAMFRQPLSTRVAKATDLATVMPTAQTRPSAADLAAARTAVRVYLRVQQLRTELALTDRDLASLGVSRTTASQILLDVKAFLSSTSDPLADVNAAYAAANRALNEAVRQVNTGEGGAAVLTSLPSLKQNRDNAAAARLSAMAPLVTQVNALLNSDQQTMWQSARANAQLERLPGSATANGPFRYVSGLTSEQIDQLESAARKGGAAAMDSTAAGLLDSSQLSVFQSARRNLRTSIAQVSIAEASILPIPDLLKPRWRMSQPAPSALQSSVPAPSQ